MRDEDAAVVIFHASEKLGEHHGGVGRPVAVVSAVEAVMRAVEGEGDGEMRVAARAEDDGLRAGLVDGAIADEEDVAVDGVGVGLENLFEVWGAGFLFSFPNETDVGVEGEMGGAEGIEGGELGEDGGFVVTGGAGVDAGLAAEVTDGGREGWDLPFGSGNGLAVVMGIEDDGVLGAGCVDVAVDDGGCAWKGEEARVDIALVELGEEEVGVAPEAVGIGGDVGDGEEGGELMDEVVAMGGGVSVRGLGGRGLSGGTGDGEKDRCDGAGSGAKHGDHYNGGAIQNWSWLT